MIGCSIPVTVYLHGKFVNATRPQHPNYIEHIPDVACNTGEHASSPQLFWVSGSGLHARGFGTALALIPNLAIIFDRQLWPDIGRVWPPSHRQRRGLEHRAQRERGMHLCYALRQVIRRSGHQVTFQHIRHPPHRRLDGTWHSFDPMNCGGATLRAQGDRDSEAS